VFFFCDTQTNFPNLRITTVRPGGTFKKKKIPFPTNRKRHCTGSSFTFVFLLRLEEEDGTVAEVEVYEVLCLVGYERAEVTADDAMPSRPFALVKLGYR